MKKYILSFLFLCLLTLCSCTNVVELKIKNIIPNEDGKYIINLPYDVNIVNISEYVDYVNEYEVEYLDKIYFSNSSDLQFEVENGENIFTITAKNKKELIYVYKEPSYNVHIVDENNEILVSKLIKESETLNDIINEFIDKTYATGYSFDGTLYYSTNNRIFEYVELSNVKLEKNIYIRPNIVKDNLEIILYVDGVKHNTISKIGEPINYIIPEKTGHRFIGWNNGVEIINNGVIYDTKYGNTFNALFEANQYKINYKNIDNEISQDVTYGQSFELLHPKKEGFTFVGWLYNDNMFSENTWTYLHDINLIAVWQENKIELNLEVFGGKVENVVNIIDGTIELPIPMLDGYTFKYWCYDEYLTLKVDTISANEYNDERLYAYYELDTENLKEQFVITRHNQHASDYSELVIFDGTKSGFTSLYWHKIGIVKQNDRYYISAIAKNGTKLSSLGTYDYVLLAYSDYKNYNDFVNGNYEIGDTVKFMFDPTKVSDGKIVNIISIVKQDISEDLKEVQNHLQELYGGINEVGGDIELLTNYNQYYISWKTSNKDAITTTGKYIKPFVNRNVTLTAVINDEEIFDFSFVVIGEHEKSTALSTGYIYTPYNTITQNAMNALDIIYIAFLDIDENANWTNLTRVTNNINNYIRDKANKAGTKIVVSVNQDGSGKFSAVAKSAELREKLATNILNVVETLNLDGVDIDWETPASTEAGNFTLMMEAIYRKLKAANPNYLVTAAIGGGKWAPPKYDLPNSKNYLDYINLMTYSMATGNGYYQNSLYKSTKGATLVSCSIEESIKIYNDLGVSNNKILVGIPFYTTVQTESGGPGSKTGNGKSIWYKYLFDTYKLSDTMKEYYDEECCVPYRYDDVNKIFISFDNERSIKRKCEYINTLGLAGIMYWQYGQDVDDMLSNAINKYINE